MKVYILTGFNDLTKQRIIDVFLNLEQAEAAKNELQASINYDSGIKEKYQIYEFRCNHLSMTLRQSEFDEYFEKINPKEENIK